MTTLYNYIITIWHKTIIIIITTAYNLYRYVITTVIYNYIITTTTVLYVAITLT